MIYEVFLSDPDVFFTWIQIICKTRADAEECILAYEEDYAYETFCYDFYELENDLEHALNRAKRCHWGISLNKLPVW